MAYDRTKQRKPKSIKAQIGWYCYETTTGICKGTYEASVASAFVALSGASLLRGVDLHVHLILIESQGSNSDEDRGKHDLVYSICRPPGHHATSSRFGGFCYLNNAALAAHYLTQSKPDVRNGERDADASSCVHRVDVQQERRGKLLFWISIITVATEHKRSFMIVMMSLWFRFMVILTSGWGNYTSGDTAMRCEGDHHDGR